MRDNIAGQQKQPRDLFQDIELSIARRNWTSAIAQARAIGLDAIASDKLRLVQRAGALLERLEDHAFAARFLAVAGRMEHPSPLPEWDGSPLVGRTLLIIQRIRHIGAAIRMSRLIPLAASRAKHCIVLAEPRLIPLYRRSFPTVEVLEAGPDDEVAFTRSDVVASYETLMQILATDQAGRIVSLTPLRPDRDAVNIFRCKYGPKKLLIGICWHSTNEEKDLPSLGDWSAFLCKLDATYVSIQYGDVRADVETMRAQSGARIVFDETVDSLKNLDLFAAQIATLDGVVTISNTGAHMAGALNVPMWVILDDKNHLVWPFEASTTGWYGSAVLVRKQRRSWPQVLSLLSIEVSQYFSKK